MELKELQKQWDGMGKLNPMWAVLTFNDRWSPDEFFASGCEEIADLLSYIESLELSLRRGVALDFGCGAGRLTQALADYFDQAHGVDIAPSMVEAARHYNTHGEKCQFHLNERPDLSLFGDNTFDLIYTNIVLQHIPPQVTKQYLRDFVRVLAAGGVLVFQLPSELVNTSAIKRLMWRAMPEPMLRTYRSFKRNVRSLLNAGAQDERDKYVMEMHGIPRDQVVQLLSQCGAKLCDVRLDNSVTANGAWTCFKYTATKS